MTTCSLNGVELSTIPEVMIVRVVRPFQTPRHRSVDIPGRAGAVIFPEEPGNRVVSIDFHIAAASATLRRQAVEQFAGWLNVGDTSRLIIDDQPDRYEEAIVDGSIAPEEWLNAAAPFPVPFLAGPYALALATSTETLNATTNPDSGSFVVPDTIDARPVIEIVPSGGGIDGFTLTVNDFSLSWSFGIEIVSAITVNTLGEVILIGLSTDTELTGAYDPSKVAMADASGFFPLLTPGTNDWSFTWTGSATSVALEVEWRERFTT